MSCDGSAIRVSSRISHFSGKNNYTLPGKQDRTLTGKGIGCRGGAFPGRRGAGGDYPQQHSLNLRSLPQVQRKRGPKHHSSAVATALS